MKKIMCIFLSVLMLFALAQTAFASSSCKCDNPPVVLIRGFGSSLFVMNEDGTYASAFGPDTLKTVTGAMDILSSVGALTVLKDYQKFDDKIVSGLDAIIGALRIDRSGNSIADIVSEASTDTDTDYHNGKAAADDDDRHPFADYIFSYDWRLSPLEIADQFNAYIKDIKAVTGHSKVVITAHSEGNNVVASYLTKYGTADVQKLVFLSPAFQGIILVGKLFTKEISLRDKSDELTLYLNTFLGGEPAGDLVCSGVSAVNDAGILGSIVNGAADLIDAALDTERGDIYNKYLIDMFATMPGIWSFVPDEYYEAAKKAMFGDNAAYAGLIEKIDDYHYNVQSKLDSTLKKVKKAGVPFSILAGYGMAPIPVYEDCNEQCDTVIDTKYMSIGATCASLGETLDFEQPAVANKQFRSPDMMIDASTCLYPSYTWFFKYQDHNDFCEPYCSFINWLIAYKGQPTVFTSSDYPQFMVCDSHEKLVAVEGPDAPDDTSNLIKMIKALFELIKSYFTDIFAQK